MKKYFKLFAFTITVLTISSCDKVDNPNPDHNNQGTDTTSHVIPTGTLLGNLDSITVTNSIIANDEMSAIEAEYLYSPDTVTGMTTAKIIFKWNNTFSDTLLAVSGSSTVSFINVPVSINAASPNGTLRFVYSCQVADTLNGDGEIFIPSKPADQLQNVLIEDFTGQRCSNCPRAARVIYNTIEPANPGRIVSIGVHAGSYAEPLPGDSCFGNDYRTTPGNELDAYFGVTAIGNPTGMINRKPGIVGNVFFDSQWNAQANLELALSSKAFVKTITHYDATSRRVIVTVGAGSYADETGNYRVAMYLTEDSIISCQEDNQANPTLVANYVQRHMLKDVIFSNWQGEDWATDPLGNVKRIKSYSYTLDPAIVAEHAGIVTFIYDATTYRIVQVTERKVIE